MRVETEGGLVARGHEYSYPAIVPWPERGGGPGQAGQEEGVTVMWTWHRIRIGFISLSLREILERARPLHFYPTQ
eukprot:scaffold1074_cov409-Prasinococcus_capsulatus_cf.AAC.10